LGLGSLTALALSDWRHRAAVLLWPAIIALVALPFLPAGGSPPDIRTAVVCIATAIVLFQPRDINTAITRSRAFVGDFSYSLYTGFAPPENLSCRYFPNVCQF
jgi:peptidoglycan/LPS O-acetylase OafA/YrhL